MRSRTTAQVAAVLALCLGTGAVAGVLWSALAPRATWRVQEGGAALDGLTNQAFIGADGTLAALCLAAGALSAAAGWALARRRTLVLLGALCAGGLLGAVLTWRTGVLIAPDDVRALARGLQVGSAFEGGLRLRAPGVLLLWPIASVVVLSALAARGARPRHTPPDREDPAELAEREVSPGARRGP